MAELVASFSAPHSRPLSPHKVTASGELSRGERGVGFAGWHHAQPRLLLRDEREGAMLS